MQPVSNDEDLLIGIINNRADLAILDERRWYRIPTTSIKSRERGWPPKWFAAFEVASLGEGQQRVVRFGRIADIQVVGRAELFPDEPPGTKSRREYYKLILEAVERLPAPLVPRRPRRNPFIRSTHRRLTEAKEFNQLFFDGAFEDTLWDALQEHVIPAERQWETKVEGKKYILDFAVFCNGDDIDVEVDGPRHHYVAEQSEYDSDRNNGLTTKGWDVLRFTTRQIQTGLTKCIKDIAETIERNGGISGDPMPRRYKLSKGRLSTQLSLLEDRTPYDAD
jgi:very-short-patch-repair endonuclease